MATPSISLSLSPPFGSSIPNPKPCYSLKTHNSSFSLASHFTVPPTISSHRRTTHFHNPPREIPLKISRIRRISAVSGDDLPLEVNPVENSQQIVSGGDDGVSSIISVLLFLAFVGLSILTIGVIYIAVTDFLQKREKEKFEKEEAAKKKKKKNGKKTKSRARTGPRGFGQKIDDAEDDD